MLTEKIFIEGIVESDKVKLHYLDWGGDGQVLVLLCGLGDTPFLFENLAKELSTQFHVIGYARRNHWRSEGKEERYDNETLVSDLKLFLDSLQIDKASLLGWSLGGNEITEFAIRYSDRVGKLIYFESGYDLSDGGFEKLVSSVPKPFLPDSSTMKSLGNYRKWYHHFWFNDVEWNDALEANLISSVKINSDSSIETIPTDDVFKTTLKEAMNYRRNYDKVLSPCLVIYTKPFFHPPDNNPATVELYDKFENDIVAPWRAANRKRIEKELKKATIVEAPKGTHASFLFLSDAYLVNAIKSFLDAEK